MTVYYNSYFVVISDITSILKETPTKYELFNLLFDIKEKWYDIGLSLQVSRHALDDFKRTRNGNEENLNAVIGNFLTSHSSSVNWETVITAIEDPIVNDKETADQIRQYLKSMCNKLLLLSNEVINCGVQTTTVRCIQFSLNQHFSHHVYQLNVIGK